MEQPLRSLGLGLAGVLLFTSLATAKEGWFSIDRKGREALIYGELPAKGEAPNPENVQLIFRCAKNRRFIRFFVAETGPELKPNRKVRVVLSIANVRHEVDGRTLPNQLAGVPSLRAMFPVKARVFGAMVESQSLRVSAGGWQISTPLSGLGNQLKRLLAACRK